VKKSFKYILIPLIILLLTTLFISCNNPTKLKLKEVEQQYSQEFRQELEKIEDKEYLLKILNDDEAVKLLNDLFISQNKDWTGPLINSGYETEDLKSIIKTVEKLSGSKAYQEAYLSYLLNENSGADLSFLSLEEQSELFEKFYNNNYPTENISSFLNKLKENKDYYNDAANHYDEILIQLKLDEIGNKYSLELKKKLESIEDENYIKAIIDNDVVLESCSDFLEWKRFDDIIFKNYSIDFLILLDETVKPLDESKRDLYINLVIDERNDKALNITLLTCDSLPDSSAAMMNIPFYIHEIETVTLSNCDIQHEMNYQDTRFVEGEYPMAKGSDFHNLFLECYNSIEKVEYNKKEFLDYLSEQLERKDIGTYYINIIGHSGGTSIAVEPIGGFSEGLYPKEIMEIINENAKNKIINLNIAGCSTNKILDIITGNNLMSEDVEYNNILGNSYVPIAWYDPQHPYILASIDRELGFLDRSEMATFDELVSFGKGEDAVSYWHGTCSSKQRGTYNCSSAFYDWLGPPEYPYYEEIEGVTVNTQYIICIDYSEYDPKRITNTNINNNFASLIVITPGKEGFFKSTD